MQQAVMVSILMALKPQLPALWSCYLIQAKGQQQG